MQGSKEYVERFFGRGCATIVREMEIEMDQDQRSWIRGEKRVYRETRLRGNWSILHNIAYMLMHSH